MFTWKDTPNKSKPVFLACSADSWVQHEMAYQDDLWRVSLNLLPGTYQYKFIVDGHWLIDKDSESISDDGITNNVITIVNERKKYFNGFGSWFNVIFKGSDKSKPPVILTTDPRIGYQTHWRQDICMYRENLQIPKDNEISGVVNIEQMNDYKRHFSITISPSERSVLRGEKPFPEQEWTF